MAPRFFGGGRSLSEWALPSHITIKNKANNTCFFVFLFSVDNQCGRVNLPVVPNSHENHAFDFR